MNKKGFIGVFILVALLGFDALVAGLIMRAEKPTQKETDNEVEILSK